MSGYYPDGVTGNEFAIAGADREFYDERDVYCNNDDCDWLEKLVTVEILLSQYRDRVWGEWKCSNCNKWSEYEQEDWYGYDD
jgi:hypothetical protein